MVGVSKGVLVYETRPLAMEIQELNQHLGCSTCPPKYHCCKGSRIIDLPVDSARTLFDGLFQKLVNDGNLLVDEEIAYLKGIPCPLKNPQDLCSVYEDRVRYGLLHCVNYPIEVHDEFIGVDRSRCPGLESNWIHFREELKRISKLHRIPIYVSLYEQEPTMPSYFYHSSELLIEFERRLKSGRVATIHEVFNP